MRLKTHISVCVLFLTGPKPKMLIEKRAVKLFLSKKKKVNISSGPVRDSVLFHAIPFDRH